MNYKEREQRINENINKYHTPGYTKDNKRKLNAVFISPGNSLEHEKLKLEVCYQFRKEGIPYITEAIPNLIPDRRIDIVNLVTNDWIEIEMDPKRAERFKGTKVIVIKGWKK